MEGGGSAEPDWGGKVIACLQSVDWIGHVIIFVMFFLHYQTMKHVCSSIAYNSISILC